jgi:excisionase family DNA binding protein
MNEIEPLDVKAAASYLKLKVSTVYNLVFYGKLPAYKPGGKRLLFKVADLERYAFSNQVGNHSQRADSILNTAPRKTGRKVIA